MTQTLLLVILFVGGIASLPWLVRRVQQRQKHFAGAAGAAPRVLSAIAVGPQQRVVTVEMGGDGERTTLVLGVTPQSIRCLHTRVTRVDPEGDTDSFSLAMVNASASASAASRSRASDRPDENGAGRD